MAVQEGEEQGARRGAAPFGAVAADFFYGLTLFIWNLGAAAVQFIFLRTLMSPGVVYYDESTGTYVCIKEADGTVGYLLETFQKDIRKSRDQWFDLEGVWRWRKGAVRVKEIATLAELALQGFPTLCLPTTSTSGPT